MSKAVRISEILALPDSIRDIHLSEKRDGVRNSTHHEIITTVEQLIDCIRAQCTSVIEEYFSGLSAEAEKNGIAETIFLEFLAKVKAHIVSSTTVQAALQTETDSLNITMNISEDSLQLLKTLLPFLQIMKRAIGITRETRIRIGALERELSSELTAKQRIEAIPPADRDEDDRCAIERAESVLAEKKPKKERLERKLQRLIEKTDEFYRTLTPNPDALRQNGREFLEFLLAEGCLTNASEIEHLLREPDDLFSTAVQLAVIKELRKPLTHQAASGGRTMRFVAALAAIAGGAIVTSSFVMRKTHVAAQYEKPPSVTLQPSGRNFRIEKTEGVTGIVLTPSSEVIPDNIGEIERKDVGGVDIPNPTVEVYQQIGSLPNKAAVRAFVERISKRNIIEYIRGIGPSQLYKEEIITLGRVLQDQNAFVVVPTDNFAVARITDLTVRMENGEKVYTLAIDVHPTDFPEWSFTWRFKIVGIKT